MIRIVLLFIVSCCCVFPGFSAFAKEVTLETEDGEEFQLSLGSQSLAASIGGFTLGDFLNVAPYKRNGSFEFPEPGDVPVSVVTVNLKKKFYAFDRVSACLTRDNYICAIVLRGEMEYREFQAAYRAFLNAYTLAELSPGIFSEYKLVQPAKKDKEAQYVPTGRQISYSTQTREWAIPEKRTKTITPKFKDVGGERRRDGFVVEESVTPASSGTAIEYQIVITDQKLFDSAVEEAEDELALAQLRNLGLY